ncbi:immunity 22 family protein [Myxococcota bacterium]|nr:immunity 22 family protein [Myxococcota bacterium]
MIERRGFVSVWLGTLRSQKALDRYLEELYFDDEAHSSEFAREFDLDGADDYSMAARFDAAPTLGALIAPLSGASSFRDAALARARALGVTSANVVIAVYDLVFLPEDAGLAKKRRMTFVGAFPYEAPHLDPGPDLHS